MIAWRLNAASLALATLLAANLVSLWDHAPLPFLAAQCIAGFAGGALYSLALTVLSDGPQPDRNFGYSVAAQVSYQVTGLLLGPTLLQALGINGLLLLILAGNVLGLACIAPLPGADPRGLPRSGGARLFTPAMLLALGGCFLFYFNVGVYWTYIELIGRAAGHGAQEVADSLALGVGLGLPGALLAAWWGERRGRVLPLALGALLIVVSAALVLHRPALAQLSASAVLYNLAWNLSLAYQYAAVNALDRSGRAVAVTPAFAAGGIALGPAVAALLLDGRDYAGVLWLCAGAALASFLCFWISARGAAPALPAPASEPPETA